MSFDVDRFLNKHHGRCKLGPGIILTLAMKDEYPCDRCNIDRKECGGDTRKVL